MNSTCVKSPRGYTGPAKQAYVFTLLLFVMYCVFIIQTTSTSCEEQQVPFHGLRGQKNSLDPQSGTIGLSVPDQAISLQMNVLLFDYPSKLGVLEVMTNTFTPITNLPSGFNESAFQQGLLFADYSPYENHHERQLWTIAEDRYAPYETRMVAMFTNGTLIQNIQLPFAPLSIDGVGHYLARIDHNTTLVYGRLLQNGQPHGVFSITTVINFEYSFDDAGTYGESMPGSSVYDEDRRWWWFLAAFDPNDQGAVQLYAYNIDTWERMATVADLPNSISALGIYQKHLYGFAYRSVSPYLPYDYVYSLVQIDPIKGVSVLKDYPAINNIMISVSTMDTVNGVLYLVTGFVDDDDDSFRIIGIDLSSYEITTKGPLCGAHCPLAMALI